MGEKRPKSLVDINLSVCLYPINVKTAEPIKPKLCVGPQWSQGRFMNDQNFKYLSPSKFDFHSIFETFENPRNFCKNPRTFLYCFTRYTIRTCSQLK